MIPWKKTGFPKRTGLLELENKSYEIWFIVV